MDVLLPVLSRWIHVGTAIVLLGGTVFQRCVLMPAQGGGGEAPGGADGGLAERVLAIWKKVVMVGILLLLLSGLYNYMLAIPQHKGDGRYHMLMGVKIILALVLFFLASVLVGRAKAFEGMRQSRGRWLAVNIVLGALVVAIAGYLKVAA